MAVFRRYAALILLVACAGGCGTINFAYSTGPTALAFIADSYLDLDSEQGAALKSRILAIREWNRSTHLAEYARFMGEVRARMAGTVTAEDVDWTVNEARKRYAVMAERVATEVAELAPQLTADNLAALKRKFERGNADYIKDVAKAGAEKQREKRFERTKEETERWFGSLSEAQEERIRAWTAALPANYPLVLEERLRRQAEFSAILAAAVDKSADRAATRARLTKLMTQWESGQSPAYRAFAVQYLAESYRMTANIVNMATPAQRETLQRRSQRWMDDMTALAARKEP